MARPGQRQTGARRTAPRKQRRVHQRGDLVSVLARTAGEVESAARRGRVTPAVRTKFQAVALLLRDERARVRAATGSDSHRAEQLKSLDGIATILATTAVQDAGLLRARRGLRRLRRGQVAQAGNAAGPRHRAGARRDRAGGDRYSFRRPERRVVPQSVISRQLANPFLVPDFSAVPQRTSRPRRLAGWSCSARC